MAEALWIGDELLNLSSSGIVHPLSPIHELNTVSLASSDDEIEVENVESDGLIKEKMFAVLGGAYGTVDVEAGGDRKVDGVDIGIF